MIKQTKKQQVENYLNELMESDNFTIDDLLELSVEDLRSVAKLKEIGKITISTVLSEYKKKYEEDFFKDLDEGFLAENPEAITTEITENKANNPLTEEEIQALKLLIKEKVEKQNSELIELKLALKNAGIDYMMLLKDYRTQKEIELKEWEGTADQ